MITPTFNPEEFSKAIYALVPEHQQDLLIGALNAIQLSEHDIERIGLTLTGERLISNSIVRPSSAQPKPDNSMWQAIVNEVYEFLCTNSKKYAQERKEGSHTIKSLITIIATAIAATFHVAIGVIAGAVTLVLLSVLKIGKNAWCKTQSAQR